MLSGRDMHQPYEQGERQIQIRLRHISRRVLGALPALVLPLLLVQGCVADSAPVDSAPVDSAPRGTGSLPAARPEVGYLAPGFTLEDLDGNAVSLSDFGGKVVFINFWTTWCPPCRIEMPEIEALYQQYREQGVIVLGIDLQEDGDTVRGFVEEGGYTFTFLLDTLGEVGYAYRVQAIPSSVFIDTEGVIRSMIVGAMTREAMETNLALAME